MEGEMISGAPRVFIYRGDQCGKVRKFFFVPQEADEFNRAEFTVCVDVAVQQVGFQHTAALLCDSWSHSQAGHSGQGSIRVQAVDSHDIHPIAQGTVVRYTMVQSSITNTASDLLPMANMAGNAVSATQQRLRAVKFRRRERLT